MDATVDTLFMDRTSQVNNGQRTRSEMQLGIEQINQELNAVMKQTQPLLEQQKRLQSQVAEIDERDGVKSQRRLTHFERDAAKVLAADDSVATSLRRPRTGQENSPGRNSKLSGLGTNSIARRIRQLPSPTRHQELDLATEIGEGLVEEVRKLQLQLQEKDELLKDVSRSRIRQERGSEELEARMKMMAADEGKSSTSPEIRLTRGRKTQDCQLGPRIKMPTVG